MKSDNEKIDFSEYIASGKCEPENYVVSPVFKSEEHRANSYILPVLCIIALLCIVGSVIYFANCFEKATPACVVNGTLLKNADIGTDNAASSNVFEPSGRVNINTADSAALCTLYGIGESRALSILAYRSVNGPFEKTEDIKNVKGIGDGIYRKIKDKICV